MMSVSRLQPLKIPQLLYNLLGSRVKSPLKFTYIAKLLVLATPVSMFSSNGVVENDDILSLLTTNRMLPMATDIRSEFSDCQWYQWQPMAVSGTSSKFTNGTIGKTPNARDMLYFMFEIQSSEHTGSSWLPVYPIS